MTKTMSLQELKDLNAAEEAALSESDLADTEELDGESDQLDAEDDQTSEEGEELDEEQEDEPDGKSDGESDGEELESWMKGSDRSVPLTEHIELRQKLKHQRNEAMQQTSELENEVKELREQIAQLKQGGQPSQAQQQSAPTAPNPKDFESEYGDIDFEKFNQANAKYLQDMIDYRLESKNADSSQSMQEQEKQQQLESVVNEHYQRAESLVKSGVVSAERFAEADHKIVEAFDSRAQGNGRQLADYLIQYVGMVSDNPEKLWFKLGVDSALLNDVIEDFQNDQTGNKGIAHLSKIDKQISKPSNIRSKAPAPAKEVKGNASVKSSSALAKRYKAAHKKGNTQEAFNVRREAKQNGIDVSNW